MIGKLLGTIIDVGIKLPVAVAFDIATLGGTMIDEPPATGELLKKIDHDIRTIDKEDKE